MYLISGLSFYKERGVLRLWWSFLGKIEDTFYLLKTLPSYRTTFSEVLSLSETKDFWKDILKQAVAVLQGTREIYRSGNSMVLPHYLFSEVQLNLEESFLFW